jgi:GTP-binding protein EngB required for normal cell division
MSQVNEVVEAVELALMHSRGLATDDVYTSVSDSVTTIRSRRGFLGNTLVIALAGGTGSGKSSLMNAFAGEDITQTGAIRPTTEQAMAWVPDPIDAGVEALLGDLGIRRKISQDRYPRLVLLDLPDHDSLMENHHAIVDKLLPHVDAVIWVVDPQKYRDPKLHEQYLRPLADYQDQFIFVLNQIDRLSHKELDSVRTDLLAALAQDGIRKPTLFMTAAAPTDGEQQGIDTLTEFLTERLDAKAVSTHKTLADLRSVSRTLQQDTMLDDGSGVEFPRRWSELRRSLAFMMIPEDPDESSAGTQALFARLNDFVTGLSLETGGSFADIVRAEFDEDRIEDELALVAKLVDDANREATPEEQPSSFLDVVISFFRGGSDSDSQGADPAALRQMVVQQLDARVGAPLAALLWRRAELAASLVHAEIEARRAERSVAV